MSNINNNVTFYNKNMQIRPEPVLVTGCTLPHSSFLPNTYTQTYTYTRTNERSKLTDENEYLMMRIPQQHRD